MSAWVRLASPAVAGISVGRRWSSGSSAGPQLCDLVPPFPPEQKEDIVTSLPERVVGMRASALGRRARRTWWALNIGPSFFAIFVFGAVYTVDLGGKD